MTPVIVYQAARVRSLLRRSVADFKLPEARASDDAAAGESLLEADPLPEEAPPADGGSEDAIDEFIQVEGTAGAEESPVLSDPARS